MNPRFFFLSLLCLLTGCKVGPNYTPPVIPLPTNFIEDQVANTPTASDENFCHWWEEAFNDPFLNQLLEETLLYNYDLRIAMERIYQARANYWVQFTSILPEFDGDFQATRFRTSQSFANVNREISTSSSSLLPPIPTPPTLSPIRNFFQTGIDAIWQIDLFGKLQRIAQSAYDTWEATIEDERGVKITVLSEVANLYVLICYYQAKVDLGKQILEFDQEILKLSEERFQAGLTNEKEVLSFLSTLEGDRAALELLEISLKKNIYSLAVLLGRLPATITNDFMTQRHIPIASGKIPETLPSDLLRRRPDITSAERSLAAQVEQIGVAVADLFPSVSLVGSSSSFAANPLQGANIGFSSDKFHNLFKSASRVWGIGALITWPIFDFGKRCAAIDIQRLLSNQSYLAYEKTVVTALQEVETALTTYFHEEQRLSHLTKQVDTDQRNLGLITDEFQAGLVDYIEVLQIKEKWLLSENAMLDSQQALGSAFIAIYNALGGDW